MKKKMKSSKRMSKKTERGRERERDPTKNIYSKNFFLSVIFVRRIVFDSNLYYNKLTENMHTCNVRKFNTKIPFPAFSVPRKEHSARCGWNLILMYLIVDIEFHISFILAWLISL